MRLFLLTALLFIAFNIFAQPVAELLEQGEQLRTNKKYDEALAIYNRIVSADTTNYQGFVQRGFLFNEMDEMEKSYDDYSKAITIYPDSALAYHYRAILLFRLMYTDEAIYDNTRAIELAVDDSMRMICFANRGNAKQQKRDFQGAYEDYSKAYFINSGNMGILNNMATSLDELGRRDEAIVFFKKIIAIDSSFIGPYVNIGFQYTQLGKYKEAITYFDKALLIEKDEPLTLNNRGLAKYHLKDFQGALLDINLSIGKYPGNAYAYKNRALVYIAQSKIENACKDLEEAQKLEFTKQYGEEVNELQKKYCSKNDKKK
ncbi:tetratricopeptide repeat protein [Terrimonas alba]|uniref:tetratricopeptide repeat protein n=1 Tax=Terrimonas alba TaxID=3349636 RepID=UPI0035F4A0C7